MTENKWALIENTDSPLPNNKDEVILGRILGRESRPTFRLATFWDTGEFGPCFATDNRLFHVGDILAGREGQVWWLRIPSPPNYSGKKEK